MRKTWPECRNDVGINSPMSTSTRKNKGFTLVELSIVIVIIGLLVGGVTAGVGLVQAAKLHTVVSEANQIKAAVLTFKLQYNQLPGDMSNAYDYWSAACDATPSKCNGNNDRLIAYTGGPADDDEINRVWQHLTLSQIFPGTYNGIGERFISSSGLSSSMIWSALNSNIFKSNGGATEVSNLNIMIGSPIGTWTAAFTVKQAKNMDTKMDDGVANTGKVIVVDGAGVAANACTADRSTVGGADFNSANLADDTAYCVVDVFLLH